MKIGIIFKQVHADDRRTHYHYREGSFTRRIGPKSDKVRVKFCYNSFDFEEVKLNTEIIKENKLILVNEPIFVDDELSEKLRRWAEYAEAHPESVKSILDDVSNGGDES